MLYHILIYILKSSKLAHHRIWPENFLLRSVWHNSAKLYKIRKFNIRRYIELSLFDHGVKSNWTSLYTIIDWEFIWMLAAEALNWILKHLYFPVLFFQFPVFPQPVWLFQWLSSKFISQYFEARVNPKINIYLYALSYYLYIFGMCYDIGLYFDDLFKLIVQ